ncbi:hypothetical protein [Halorussus lipolyticus]|uniref:hypothetical protein n=1 Tax=Halorussus lipolyticus TaxID=3034024 RepID=UPI0023E7D857|nr:hypothetical protein [Halorussus sp. DT80]
MMRHSWLDLDDLRESWLFLIIGEKTSTEEHSDSTVTDETDLDYWELGTGNADALINTAAARVGIGETESQRDLLVALLDELRPYRYQGGMLVTPDEETVTTLRRALVESQLEAQSLRGLAHADLEELLNSYLGQELSDYQLASDSRSPPRINERDREQVVSTGTVEQFWETWTRVFHLFPPSELTGVPL